ncbi:MAG: metal-dependent phosphohydrolase [Alphaproteobacteria bacterium]|nr:metal-dependent phosphohydrolase [Alphaproteobacteria bacterium]
MFSPTQTVIDAFVEHLKKNYYYMFGLLEPEFPNIIAFCARMALENIANSDALYHDVNHTIMVTQVGQEVLKGKHLREGGVTPSDWLHFVISLLCHDIGYVRGVCRQDRVGEYVIGLDGQKIKLPPGATDASLTAHHVVRTQLFVRERFSRVPRINVEVICANIEFTLFPVPRGEESASGSYPSLLRGADLIGQMADIAYLRKASALFYEFYETGTNTALGLKSPDDLRASYPKFFWHMVRPHIEDALHYLEVTQEGKLWIANLYNHVFVEEHKLRGGGETPVV